jgi:hypothetical protein
MAMPYKALSSALSVTFSVKRVSEYRGGGPLTTNLLALLLSDHESSCSAALSAYFINNCLKYVIVIRVILRLVVKGARKEFPRYPLKPKMGIVAALCYDG